MQASCAPLVIVPSIDHSDGVPGPGLGHLTHSDHGVLLRVILQDVVIICGTTNIVLSTCNCYVLGFCQLLSWFICQLSLPKISTRSLMLIAFSPLMGWGSLAPKAQLPSEGSNISVESRISAPSHPPATKKIWQQNWMKFKIFSILCHFISPSSLLTCSWYRHAGISQCWGKGGPPASPGCCTQTLC